MNSLRILQKRMHFRVALLAIMFVLVKTILQAFFASKYFFVEILDETSTVCDCPVAGTSLVLFSFCLRLVGNQSLKGGLTKIMRKG